MWKSTHWTTRVILGASRGANGATCMHSPTHMPYSRQRVTARGQKQLVHENARNFCQHSATTHLRRTPSTQYNPDVHHTARQTSWRTVASAIAGGCESKAKENCGGLDETIIIRNTGHLHAMLVDSVPLMTVENMEQQKKIIKKI